MGYGLLAIGYWQIIGEPLAFSFLPRPFARAPGNNGGTVFGASFLDPNLEADSYLLGHLLLLQHADELLGR